MGSILRSAMAAITMAIPTAVSAQPKPVLDYGFYKSRVEPIFLAKKDGHTRRDGHLMASRPPCDRLYRPVAAFFSQQGPAPASSVGAEGEHPLDVPCHGHEAPLAAHLVEPAQQELAESEYRFDDAEHRFRGLFAQSIELPAFWRFQPMRHGLDRRWVFRRGRCIGE